MIAQDEVARSRSDEAVTALTLVRPVATSDLDKVLALARKGGVGLTNLPPDRAALAKRIAASEAAVASADARAAGAAIMLVGEQDGDVVGTAMIFARVGAEWPFYSYRITRQAAVSRAIGRTKEQRLLNLVNDFDGEVEVGGLFVDPARRGQALGRLMARVRYLFIARHRDWFAHRVIAELRGWQEADGRSPVWEAIGRHFYDMDFHDADRTGAIEGNQFIADLGPRYPLYLSLLPPDARAALGRPHDDGRPARDMLLAEGFRDEGYVDIFDGGPTLVADIDAVKTVRETEPLILVATDGAGAGALVGTGQGASFRAAVGPAQRRGGGVALGPALAAALAVTPDEPLCVAPA
ncbi:arginine N-succinyltransferase [Sphingomonas sp.]|uniref:arginine N-succinyltransferase n=1 Tax=Sphingomonas sp. TaxID=28214 RepID=UPI003CC6C549